MKHLEIQREKENEITKEEKKGDVKSVQTGSMKFYCNETYHNFLSC